MEKEKEDKINKYEDCCCYPTGKCGSFKRHNVVDTMLFINQLGDLDVKKHLVTLKVMRSNVENCCGEQRLIESRLKKQLGDHEQICSYHRYNFGTAWKPPKVCCHPHHENRKGVKSPALRPVPMHVGESMSTRYSCFIAIGSLICFSHLKSETSFSKKSSSKEVLEAQHEQTFTVSTSPEKEFVPEQVIVSQEVLDDSIKSSEDVTEILNASPVKFRLKRKFELIEDSTKEKLKKKYARLEKQLQRKFAESVAPGQEEEIINFLNKNNEHEEHKITNEIKRLIAMYKESDSLGKMVVLSFLDHSRYTKQFICEIFGCTKYAVEVARKWNIVNKGLALPEKKVFTRSKLDEAKCEHFLDFLFNSGLLHDVAYGVTNIKYDSGQQQKVAHAILTTKYSHAIMFYKKNCIETDYEHLSESSLWKILHTIKPSKRKCLAGLDDVIAAGMNGFEALLKIAQKYFSKDVEDALQQGKRYLKTQYQVNCDPDSKVYSHSTKHALSDPNDPHLQSPTSVSNDACLDCYNLCKAISSVRKLVNENSGDDDTKYDLETAIQDINNYIKHLIRDSQQRKAKIEAFDNLDNKTAFWLKDFCQKILPVRYREGQREYFGKKGMSLHVDVFFVREHDQLKKRVYFTAIYRCEQNVNDVVALSTSVLDQFRKDEPSVENLYTKSDNAGCYQGNYSAEAVYDICKKKGLNLLRYDYNEPCCGKDQCDRDSASAKAVIRSFVDSGNDLITAEDIYKAMHYGYGVKNAEVSVVEIDKMSTSIDGPKIKNISNFHSIEFNETSMTMWRYFNIGKGIKQPYNKLEVKLTIETLLPYSNTESSTVKRIESKKKKRSDRQLCSLRFCPDSNCTCSFETDADLEEHILSGKHVFPALLSSMDKVRSSFVEKMKLTSELHTPSAGSSSQVLEDHNIEDKDCMSLFKSMGWALPVRSTFRFSKEQKSLLYFYFMQGENSGKKMSPEQVHMKLRKDLTPDQYVTSSQIRSLFSRWSKQKRQGGTILEPSNEDLELPDEQNEDLDAEMLAADIRVLAEEICMKWRENDWVAVMYEMKWYLGYIVEVASDGITVNCMNQGEGKNMFRWPEPQDQICYQAEDLLCLCDAPFPVNRREDYSLSGEDYNNIKKIFKEKISSL